MRIFRCLVGFQDGYAGTLDGFAFEGKLWLAGVWRPNPDGLTATPLRSVRFDNQHHQKVNPQEGGETEYSNILLPISYEAFAAGKIGIEHLNYPNGPSVPVDQLADKHKNQIH